MANGGAGSKKLERIAYTRREAAELLGVHVCTVSRVVKRGELPARRLGGRLLIPAAALHAWLEGGETLNEPEAIDN